MATSKLSDMFKVPELRARVFFTLTLLVIFRVGAMIPIPGINASVINAMSASSLGMGGVADTLDFFTGGAFSSYSILMLGIMPYISAQIIMQVLTIVFPALKRMLEEDGGRRKFHRYTRMGTIIVCLIQGFAFVRGALGIEGAVISTMSPVMFMTIGLISVTTGSIFLIWLGERITQRGVGNGISLIIFAGIIARIPEAIVQMMAEVRTGTVNGVFVFIAIAIFVGIVAIVAWEQQGERKIPVNYAKRIVGRQMVQAQNSYIPFKINPSGVIPIIFASSVLTLPLQFAAPLAMGSPFWEGLLYHMRYEGPLFNTLYALLIIFFAYFYTQVSLNPIEVARRIRENGGVIPGVRSEAMESYLQKILNRIVLPGAIFLAAIALVPTFIVFLMGLPPGVAHLMGGTSLLIIVGVNLDTMNQIDSHLRMHQHDGIVAKGRIKPRNI
ncbi:MAG: preprotein translocase subunit SecY [Spirochaetaceae bacterium]|nr:preprotein translocase subunit SecY [Spirochaetaceae bacterium]